MPWFARSVVAAPVAAPVDAKEVRLMCPHCQGFATAKVPLGATSWRRQQLIRDAIDEHRVVCTAADATEGRVYRIDYPRV